MACGVSSSLYDLSGNKIEDTYQRLLQKGDDDILYDGTGSLVNNIEISGSLSASYFSGSIENTHGVNQDTKCYSIAMALVLG